MGGLCVIRHITTLTVPNATAEQFYDFMSNPVSERYHAWWPEEHLAFFLTKPGESNHLRDEVYYDEYLGKSRRLKFFAVVVAANRPYHVAWQMKMAGVRLPAVLSVKFTDTSEGLEINHELRIGFGGAGKILDPFIRLYFTKSYASALEKHCLEEWPRLAAYLAG
jgi:hypothetical protein